MQILCGARCAEKFLCEKPNSVVVCGNPISGAINATPQVPPTRPHHLAAQSAPVCSALISDVLFLAGTSCRRTCWRSRWRCWSASTAAPKHAAPPSSFSARSASTNWCTSLLPSRPWPRPKNDSADDWIPPGAAMGAADRRSGRRRTTFTSWARPSDRCTCRPSSTPTAASSAAWPPATPSSSSGTILPPCTETSVSSSATRSLPGQ